MKKKEQGQLELEGIQKILEESKDLEGVRKAGLRVLHCHTNLNRKIEQYIAEIEFNESIHNRDRNNLN